MQYRRQLSYECASLNETVSTMQANGVSTSTQSFGINENRRPLQRKRRFYILCLAGVLIALAVGFVIGYFIPKDSDDDSSSSNVVDSKDKITLDGIQTKLLSMLDRKSIENFSREFSSQPHLAASQRSMDLAKQIQENWESYGFDDVALPTYEVLLSFLKPNTANKVNIITSDTRKVIYETVPLSGSAVPAFLAYAASGVIEGDLVYVNYGMQNDFEELEKKYNVSVKGKIVIVRYGRIYRGSKVAIATRWGAIGVLIYPDPSDYAPYGSYFPDSWFLPPNATQRGSVYPGPSFGDPLTHGLPATPGMLRTERDKANLPKIPAHALTFGEAVHLLKRMTGPEVPELWRGGLNITYRIGPGFQNVTTKVQLNVTTENVVRNITNVIGTIKGDVEPDRIVLIGAHRDAWVNGIVDPVSAMSVMVELSRAVGTLLKSGWRPRRTIKFCSWGAEEHALIGSTEWVEENYKMLSERAVAYLNLDLAVNGNFTMKTFSSPLLNQLILDSLKNITDPTDSNRSLYEVMSERNPSPEKTPTLGTLGTVSDYASFYQYLAIPSIDWGYYFTDKKAKVFFFPVYHSSAETFQWMKKFVDPEFKIHLAVAKLGGIFLIRLCDSLLLPMASISDYSKVLENSLQAIKQDPLIKNVSFAQMKRAIDEFKKNALLLEEQLTKFQNEKDFRKLRVLNDQMRQVEKSFLYPDGLPGRNEFKNIIFAPSLNNVYASAKFPGITDALFDCKHKKQLDCEEAYLHISIVINTIQQAAQMLKPIL